MFAKKNRTLFNIWMIYSMSGTAAALMIFAASVIAAEPAPTPQQYLGAPAVINNYDM